MNASLFGSVKGINSYNHNLYAWVMLTLGFNYISIVPLWAVLTLMCSLVPCSLIVDKKMHLFCLKMHNPSLLILIYRSADGSDGIPGCASARLSVFRCSAVSYLGRPLVCRLHHWNPTTSEICSANDHDGKIHQSGGSSFIQRHHEKWQPEINLMVT